jgi:FkbM family methyltransferase
MYINQIKQIVKLIVYKLAPSVSQAGQDAWVFGEVFNGVRNGFFLDIGANDGLIHSNSFKLEQRFKWSGICIEANPNIFKNLKSNRKAICVNACLADKAGEVYFRMAGEFGEVVPKNNFDGSDIKMQTIPLEKVLVDNNAPYSIDYLSIDIEGSEEIVLRGFPFHKYTFKCITIERPSNMIRHLLKENGYLLIKEIPDLDCFYIHKSFFHIYKKNMFNFWEKETLLPLFRKAIRYLLLSK